MAMDHTTPHQTVISTLDGWEVEVFPGVDIAVAQTIADTLGIEVDFVSPEILADLLARVEARKSKGGMTAISERFNSGNLAELRQLQDWFGYARLTYGTCDALGRLQTIKADHADRMIAAGHNIYVDVPIDPSCPVERYRF